MEGKKLDGWVEKEGPSIETKSKLRCMISSMGIARKGMIEVYHWKMIIYTWHVWRMSMAIAWKA